MQDIVEKHPPGPMPRAGKAHGDLVDELVELVKFDAGIPGHGWRRLSDEMVWEFLIGRMRLDGGGFKLDVTEWMQMLDQFEQVPEAKKGTKLCPDVLTPIDWGKVEQATNKTQEEMRDAIERMPHMKLVGTRLRREFGDYFDRKNAREGNKEKGLYPYLWFPINAEQGGRQQGVGHHDGQGGHGQVSHATVGEKRGHKRFSKYTRLDKKLELAKEEMRMWVTDTEWCKVRKKTNACNS